MYAEINRLVTPPPPENSLKAADTPPAIREKTGLERTGQGGQVAGSEVTVQSTDGLFLFTVRVVK